MPPNNLANYPGNTEPQPNVQPDAGTNPGMANGGPTVSDHGFAMTSAQMSNISLFGAKTGILTLKDQALSFTRKDGTNTVNIPLNTVQEVIHAPRTSLMVIKTESKKYRFLLTSKGRYETNLLPTGIGVGIRIVNATSAENSWQEIKPILAQYVKVVESTRQAKSTLGVLILIFFGIPFVIALIGVIKSVVSKKNSIATGLAEIGLIIVIEAIIFAVVWLVYKLSKRIMGVRRPS